MSVLYSLGCDVAKDEHVVCLLRYDVASQQWQKIGQKTCKNTPSGAKALTRWLQRRTDDPQGPVRVTMEATGIYYERLAVLIHDHYPQIHLSVVLASQAKAYHKSRGLRNKTDKIDAFGLALMGAERKLTSWRGIDPFWRKLREMTRSRSRLIKQKTEVRNRLHAHNRSAVVIEEVQASLQTVLDTLECQSEQLMKKITEHLQANEHVARRVRLLETIPGVAIKTIAVILAETLGFTYFTSISQLMCFSGYDVLIKDSGKRKGKRQISKQGSSHIRGAMYMPASTIVRRKPVELFGYYQRLLSSNKVKMKAHVALQKKLLSYIFILWKTEQAYDVNIIIKQRKEQERLKNRKQASSKEQTDAKQTQDAKPTQKEIAPPNGEATEDTRGTKPKRVPPDKLEKNVDF